MTDRTDPLHCGGHDDHETAARAAGWDEGYGAGRDDEADALPLRENPHCAALSARNPNKEN